METVSCFTFFKSTLFHRTCSYSALLNCFRGRWLSWHRKLEVTLVVWKCVECILNVPSMSCMHLHPISTVVLDFVFFRPLPLCVFQLLHQQKGSTDYFFIVLHWRFFFPIPLPTYSTSEHSAQNDRLSALRDEDSKLWCTITPTFQGSRSLSCNWKHHQTQDQNPWGETLLGSMEKAHETSNKESKHQKESELSKTKPILFRISLKSYSNHGPQWGGHINHKVIRWWPSTSTATHRGLAARSRPHDLIAIQKLTGSWIQTKLEINILQLIKQSSHSQRVEYKNGPIRFVCEMC